MSVKLKEIYSYLIDKERLEEGSQRRNAKKTIVKGPDLFFSGVSHFWSL